MIGREKTLLHFLPFAILVLNEKNEIIYINPKGEELFNFTFVLNERVSIKNILSDENLKIFSFVAGRVRAKGENTFFMVQEDEKFLELFLSPIHGEKDVIGLLITVVDLTEEVKSTFTKLSFVKGIFSEAESILENLKSSLDNPSSLPPTLKKLEDSLMKIKMELVTFPAKKGKVELKYVVKIIIDEMEGELSKRGLKINYRFTPSPVSIFINKEKFERFFFFLLKEIPANTDGGHIWVTVDEGRIDNTRYGLCILTFSGKIDRDSLQPLEDFVKEEDGMFEIVEVEGIGTTIGIALPSI